jgi:hypothetical protein
LNLIFQLSPWFIVLCLIGGAGFAALLYYRERRSELPARLRWLLAGFRFLAITIIAILLLSPLIRSNTKTLEKPVIIIAQDNSKSLLMNRDSVYYRGQYMPGIKRLFEELSQDYDVKAYQFSDRVTEGLELPFNGQETDISALIDDMKIRYANRNVGAMILATDGIYNKGNQPLYESEGISFPIYTIAMGDTNTQKDLIISEVNYNKVCYLGNNFPVEVLVKAQKCRGASTTLTVSRNGQTFFSKVIAVGDDPYFETVPLSLKATQSGLVHYRIALSPVNGEISVNNNYQDIYVDVLDARQKILILAAAPHPDISAIRQSLELNSNYEVEVAMLRDFNKNPSAYNLVILDQVPAKGQLSAKVLSDAAAAKVPLLYILGSSSDLVQFNNQNSGLKIVQAQGRTDEAQAMMNNDFMLFTLDEPLTSVVQDAPPLITPYGDYKLSPSMVPLFFQKIGNVSTRKPLIAFSQGTEVRNGIICGEGIWKWRLNNYMNKGNHDAFNELIGKMIQYLSIKEDKSLFRVDAKNRFSENESVQFGAELYNENYEMINEPDVMMKLSDAKGKKYEFSFSKTAHAYHLNAGLFPAGDYSWEAQVKVGNKLLSDRGEFSVSEVFAESINLVADHSLLNSIAVRHKGEMVAPANMESLVDKIKSRDDIVTVSYEQKQYSEIINMIVVLLLIIALLAAEWFLRKRGGAY